MGKLYIMIPIHLDLFIDIPARNPYIMILIHLDLFIDIATRNYNDL